MFTFTKRTLAAAAAVVAVSAPSTAYARFNLNPDPAPPVGEQAQAATRQLPVTPVPGSAPRSGATTVQASSGQGFHWGDAGLGAAGVLVLVSAGAGSAMVISRRTRTARA